LDKVTSTQHERNPYVSLYAKQRARGICELCERPAPFSNSKGEPYLETHHIVSLARGGDDTVLNTVALCPNCHQRMHLLDDNTDKKKLNSAAQRWAKGIGLELLPT
jgi:5-methylcytosine-specific restriction protein A